MSVIPPSDAPLSQCQWRVEIPHPWRRERETLETPVQQKGGGAHWRNTGRGWTRSRRNWGFFMKIKLKKIIKQFGLERTLKLSVFQHLPQAGTPSTRAGWAHPSWHCQGRGSHSFPGHPEPQNSAPPFANKCWTEIAPAGSFSGLVLFISSHGHEGATLVLADGKTFLPFPQFHHPAAWPEVCSDTELPKHN